MQHVSRDVAGRTSRSRNAARRVHAAARPSRIRMESSGTPAESQRERFKCDKAMDKALAFRVDRRPRRCPVPRNAKRAKSRRRRPGAATAGGA